MKTSRDINTLSTHLPIKRETDHRDFDSSNFHLFDSLTLTREDAY